MRIILTSFLACVLPLLAAQPYNVLVVMLDDWGVDYSSQNTHPDALIPETPEIDALAAAGVTFTEFRTSAQCAQTRASFLTGRYPFRTTVTWVGETLPESEYTIADDLGDHHSYQSAMFGKWNLGGTSEGAEQDFPRTLGGFDHFAGSFAVFNYRTPHYGFNKTINGGASFATAADTYITTDQADDTIAWIGTATEPWFVELCFHAPHFSGTGDYLYPPVSLQRNYTGTPNTDGDHLGYLAMLEAIDTEIGRVLDACDLSQTVVVVFGDNGSPAILQNGTSEYYINPPVPSGRTKGSDYDNGVHSPLIIRSPGTVNPGRTSNVFCHMVDLYPTIVKLATGSAANSTNPLDGQDISGVMAGGTAPLKVQWDSDNQNPDIMQSVSNGKWKLYDYSAADDELYNLEADPYEQSDYGVTGLTGQAAYNYKNLRYARATFTEKTLEPETSKRFAKLATVGGGLTISGGGITANDPAIDSPTITCDEVAGATAYTLWKKAGDFAAWEDTGLTPSISGGVVTFTDPSPAGRPTYRITNDAPEP